MSISNFQVTSLHSIPRYKNMNVLSNCLKLPQELLQKIFLYSTSPVAEIFKKEKFFGRPFPFLYCPNSSWMHAPPIVQEDFFTIHRQILRHRKLQLNYKPWKYEMFHIHSIPNEPEYFIGVDRLYFISVPCLQPKQTN